MLPGSNGGEAPSHDNPHFMRLRSESRRAAPLSEVMELAELSVLLNRSICGAREAYARSEEHTSELQSLRHLVCRLLLEKKNKQQQQSTYQNNQENHYHNKTTTCHSDQVDQ